MRSRFLSLLFLLLAAAAPADDLETTVARMARIGSASSPSFSPDGSRLAFVSNLGGLPQVWSVPADGGWPEAVTALDDPVGFVEWSPDGSELAFTLAPGGGMNEQVYLVRPDGTGLRRLTAGGKETNRFSGFTHDGRELVLGGNARDGSAIDAYLLGVAGGAARGATRTGGINGYTDVSRDGKRAVLTRLVSRGDNNLYLVDLETGQETLLTPHAGPGSFGDGVFSPDGRRVYLSSNQGRDLAAFARVVLDAQGRPGPIEVIAARDDAELQQLAIDDSGTTAALLWNVAGKSELAFVDLATRPVHVPDPRCPRRSPSAWPSPATAASSRSPPRALRRPPTSGSSIGRRARCASSRAARTPASTCIAGPAEPGALQGPRRPRALGLALPPARPDRSRTRSC